MEMDRTCQHATENSAYPKGSRSILRLQVTLCCANATCVRSPKCDVGEEETFCKSINIQNKKNRVTWMVKYTDMAHHTNSTDLIQE